MARVIGVCSGKGGVGKTTIVTNLAIALKELGQRVLIIDCNLSTPHMTYYMGAADYKYTLNDVMAGKVDVSSAVHAHYGIKYIPASLDMKDLIGLEPTSIRKHLKKLMNSDQADIILLDSAPGLGREALTVLDAADEIILVTTPFAPMLNDVMRCGEVLKHVKGAKNVNIVLNMVTDGAHEINSSTITDVTGMPVLGKIPLDNNVIFGLVMKSPVMNYRPDSDSSIGFMQLASNMLGQPYKLPMKTKLKTLLTKTKNYMLPQRVVMPQSAKEVRRDIFIQKE